jgi:iron(III) transport system ATP-binding protein
MILQVKDLTFSHNKQKNIFNNFNLSAKKGEIIGIVGDSGSGKSTLLRILTGFEKIVNGEILVEGSVISSKNVYLEPHNRKIGMVFQDYGLFPHLNVEKNILFGLHKLDKQEKNIRVQEMLALTNMEEYKTKNIHELSGGQQQRIALARSLAPKPKILLMDEPFSNLDCTLKAKIRSEVKDILKKEGITCLFVSHDIEDVKDVCDRSIYI